MRMRISSGEFIYTLQEFSSLPHSEICRHYGLGDEWLDETRNEAADKEVELSGTAH